MFQLQFEHAIAICKSNGNATNDSSLLQRSKLRSHHQQEGIHFNSQNDALPLLYTHKIDVKVTSPSGHVFHHGDNVDYGNFAFTTYEAGHYMICFWPANHQPPVTFSIDFDWKFGVAAKDWSNQGCKENADFQVMELELRKLYDAVTSIHQEMFYLRGREEEMQQLNRATNSKMATLSFLSFPSGLLVRGWNATLAFESFLREEEVPLAFFLLLERDRQPEREIKKVPLVFPLESSTNASSAPSSYLHQCNGI